MIRVELNDLEENHKLEYRALKSQLKKHGCMESFPISDEINFTLPNGTYAIEKLDYTQEQVFFIVEKAIKKALYPYYGSRWVKKYSLIVLGPTPIISRNLEEQNS